jgi:hypothetical protein
MWQGTFLVNTITYNEVYWIKVWGNRHVELKTQDATPVTENFSLIYSFIADEVI